MNKWISVKDRLSEKDIKAVLITNEIDMYVAVEWWAYKGQNPLEADWSYSYCCGCKAIGVTHWQPLPAPPGDRE